MSCACSGEACVWLVEVVVILTLLGSGNGVKDCCKTGFEVLSLCRLLHGVLVPDQDHVELRGKSRHEEVAKDAIWDGAGGTQGKEIAAEL
jgi:hypothetical protein